MTLSLRTRLLAGIILGMVVLLTVFSVWLYVIACHRLLGQFDGSLLRTATMLSAVVEREEEEGQDDEEDPDGPNLIYDDEQGGLEFELDVAMTPEFHSPNGGGYYQLWGPDGTVILRSPSLGGKDLSYVNLTSTTPIVGKAHLPDGRPGRLIRYRFTPRSEDGEGSDGAPLILAVAVDAMELYGFLGFLRWVLISGSLVVVLLSALVALKVAQAGLHPVHTLAGEIESVDEQSLRPSFCAGDYPSELAPICERLNALLGRLRNSFERERQFNGDVAHELRTPLAGIQASLEVCLRKPRSAEQYAETLQASLSIVKTTHRLVDALLALSRLDAGERALNREPVELKALIDERWRLFADRAHDRRLTFENHVAEPLVCSTSKDHLVMIVTNVLDNAVEYADEGGHISVTAQESEGFVVLSISNTGCRLSPDEVAKVFDSFWRADAARTDTGAHCGLGLAVVRKVAQALGAPVRAVIDPDNVFILHLELPHDSGVLDADSQRRPTQSDTH